MILEVPQFQTGLGQLGLRLLAGDLQLGDSPLDVLAFYLHFLQRIRRGGGRLHVSRHTGRLEAGMPTHGHQQQR